MTSIRNKQRPFRLLKYLYENTDEEHPISTTELVRIFVAEDAHAKRKTVKDDIDVLVGEGFDIVTARAVAPLNILLEYAMPITKINSCFIALKGKIEDDNNYKNALKILKSEIIKIEKFKLPIEDSDRTIYKIRKNGKIKRKYPRNPSEIKKNML